MPNGWHEDYENEVVCPELFEDHYDERFDEVEEDEELRRDMLLERQELEDFEGIDHFADSDVGNEW